MAHPNFFCTALLFIASACISLAQVQIEVGPQQSNAGNTGIVVYGSDGLSRNIPYTKIKGSPFWKDEWLKAFFYDLSGKRMGSFNAKFNLTNQEFHYLDPKGEEKALSSAQLSKVVFMNPADSSKVLTTFFANEKDIQQMNDCKNCFIQELNEGHTILLKITKRKVSSRDSLFGTQKAYFFTDQPDYFVKTGDLYNKLKRLNKDYFFTYIPGGSSFLDWIKEKDLKFKKEEEYLLFLQHYNTEHKKD